MPMRTSYEPGHKPKFLVIIDDTPECDRALYFAARRAARLQGGLVLARVFAPESYSNWFGGDVMREEAEDKARETLDRAAGRARAIAGIEAEMVMREGEPAEEIVRLIDEDRDIVTLVLAAGSGKDGPGPLVSTLAGQASGSFPIPIAVIPGLLTDQDIDTLS
jgi:nucleotide-binding universal stress UspA family protein